MKTGSNQIHSDYLRRRKAWLDYSGLILSKADWSKALPFIRNNYELRSVGFDHTKVYYSREYKFHLILTEPYSDVEDIIKALSKEEFAYAKGKPNTGLWYPPNTHSLLLAKPQYKSILDIYASLLPMKDD